MYYAVEGHNESETWIIIGKLDNGKYFCYTAYTDWYTGFEIGGTMSLSLANSLEKLINFGVDKSVRLNFISFQTYKQEIGKESEK